MEFIDIDSLLSQRDNFEAIRSMVHRYMVNWFGVVRLIDSLIDQELKSVKIIAKKDNPEEEQKQSDLPKNRKRGKKEKPQDDEPKDHADEKNSRIVYEEMGFRGRGTGRGRGG